MIEIRKSNNGYELSAEIDLDCGREEVFSFFSAAENLQILTPDFLDFEILSPLPITMKVGATIVYRISLHHIPIHWHTEISAWEPDSYFVDTQTKGPYRRWVHHHYFEDIPAKTTPGTRVRDLVEYYPIGGGITNSLFVAKELRKIFSFRHEALEKHFGTLEKAHQASA